jgi:hypothetical protein
VCDFGLVCGHYTDKPSPRLLWPDPDDADLFSIEFLAPPSEAEQAAWEYVMAQRTAQRECAGDACACEACEVAD